MKLNLKGNEILLKIANKGLLFPKETHSSLDLPSLQRERILFPCFLAFEYDFD
jgi:hypothetical protein